MHEEKKIQCNLSPMQMFDETLKILISIAFPTQPIHYTLFYRKNKLMPHTFNFISSFEK